MLIVALLAVFNLATLGALVYLMDEWLKASYTSGLRPRTRVA
jgi:hypothetical protein